jgi:MFS family permease
MIGARGALFLLLGINLFNYIDRQVLAAVEPDIRATFFAANDVNAMTKTGLLGDAFFVTYMVSAPLLGLLADRFSRWIIIGSAVICGASPAVAPVWPRPLQFSLQPAYSSELARVATGRRRQPSCPICFQSKSGVA